MGLEEVDVRMLRRGIGTLTPPRESGAPAVVVKLLGRHTCVTGPGTGQARGVPQTEVCVACHEALSEANVAVPLLARTADFIVEPRGWLRGWGAGAAETCVDNARLAQRLHATSTEWFTQSLRQRPGPVPALFPVSVSTTVCPNKTRGPRTSAALLFSCPGYCHAAAAGSNLASF